MNLKDRVEDEMIVDSESLLEEEFDRAKDLFKIFEDGTIMPAEKYRDDDPHNQLLIHLIAQQYLVKAERADNPGLSNSYFYERVDKDDSTIRHYLSDLTDEGLIRKDDDGNRVLVVERITDAIDRISEDNPSE